MSDGHFYDAGGYIDHGEAGVLLPVDELQATIHTHRDAELALHDVPAESVLAVKPTGMASSCALTQRPLAAIEVASLTDERWDELNNIVDGGLTQFTLIQIGRSPFPSQNHSLAEY